ncbi:Bacterial regulatory proteins, luxR family [Thalassovita gelatinovora]|uniref:Bacterial regulatory proteins, luxR family n=1 Tax=Thalassovita gelatinovora TaxID=53501 RepID=A0A0P1G5D8_THAGE|nr:helix-turn-helix transcriptional regulator [Thalassovita gelatinovora]QIZ81718.1 helix-turn-helix transcriptional regulator [Thalassovita gelatinovora]CUH68288.1 Bacterial regulatory proteins, luxR family [Thalassovita gelatinovora]SEQ32734.1 regulatory protein, luxR family [Thalassovita gelatinovora]
MRSFSFITLIFVIQAVCAIFFVSDILLTVLGLRSSPISWQTRELLEIVAALGLLLGLILGAGAILHSMKEARQVRGQLRVASGAFMELLEEKFDLWALTPAERDVAMFSIKGMNTGEIAGLRNTSEGTVKAQTNAIYRKAQVTSRPQLLSLFIEDLMADALPGVDVEPLQQRQSGTR